MQTQLLPKSFGFKVATDTGFPSLSFCRFLAGFSDPGRSGSAEPDWTQLEGNPRVVSDVVPRGTLAWLHRKAA